MSAAGGQPPQGAHGAAPGGHGAAPGGDRPGCGPLVTVAPDAGSLAVVVAVRLAETLAAAQAAGGAAPVVLPGGTTAARTYAVLREHPSRVTVDWSRVDVWWGDERFLPAGHADRNETQARAALLDALPLAPSRVHPMPATDGPTGDDPVAAAAAYAADLAAAAPQATPAVPGWDVLLLGVGEDGHIASVFPGHPLLAPSATVSAVTGSPKPPPVRLTLTPQAVHAAREVWLIAAGEGKSAAVTRALAEMRTGQPLAPATTCLPAAAVRGTEVTRWFLDREAAAGLAADRW